MQIQLIFVACCLTLLAVTSAKLFAARYDDFKVYRVQIKDEEQLSEFQKLAEHLPLRILNEIRGPGHISDIVIDPANQRKLERELRFFGFDFERVIENLQRVLEEEQGISSNAFEPDHIRSYSRLKTLQGRFNIPHIQMNWTHYQRLPVIYNWLDKLAVEHPNLITSYVIGYSYENRPIKAIKISAKPGNKAIFIESNIHAIEWISSATSSCFIQNLTKSSDEELKSLLEDYDWIYVPILNPDGHVYSHDVNRLWRKNRKPTGFFNSTGPCYGVDMNRNFDYKWGVSAYNYDVPCDHWYAGAKGDTEPEVRALEHFINSFEDGYICIYLALHSYGQYVLLPYGHTTTKFPPNYDQMMRICTAFAGAAKEKYGTEFQCGASGLLNYPVSGSAKDWAYGIKKINFTATLELRDKGQYGFFLPQSQILDVCDEVTQGLKAMVKKAKEEGLFDQDH